RKKFNKDFLIDLVGYRRYGHNEMDEPRVTQPLLYKQIDEHPSVAHILANKLQDEGVVTEQEFQQMKKDVNDELQKIYDSMRGNDASDVEIQSMLDVLQRSLVKQEAAVLLETFKSLNELLLRIPDHLNKNRKLRLVLRHGEGVFDEGMQAVWGT